MMTNRFSFPAGSLFSRFLSLPGGRDFPAMTRRNSIGKYLIQMRLAPKTRAILRPGSQFFPLIPWSAGKEGGGALGSELDDLLAHSLGDGFGAGRSAELSEQRFDMELDGMRRNSEEPRHLLVGHAVAESGEHLDF